MEDAIVQVLARIEKNYGEGRVKKVSQLPDTKDNIISTGVIGLDTALGIGGIKKGSIVEIYGPESAGKTTLALQLCKQYLQLGKSVLYIDTERTLTKDTIDSRGISDDNFYLMYADNLEMALNVCKESAFAFSAIVIDSLAGLAPVAQIKGDIGDSHVGTFSKIMSDALSVLTPILDNAGCTLIVINQLREKIGVMFGNPEKATGGRALKFYAAMRLDVRRTETLKQNGEIIGCRVRVKAVKNKIATPFKETEYDIMFGHGISVEGDTLDYAVKNGIISKGSAWYSYKSERIGQGRENARQYLVEHPKVHDEIMDMLRGAMFA